MGRSLTLILPDDIFEAVRHSAAATGKTPEKVAVECLARLLAAPSKREPSGRDRVFRSYAGALNSGNPDSSDNDRIDADLARVSFIVMKERGYREALTTDRHFEQEGFTRLLRP